MSISAIFSEIRSIYADPKSYEKITESTSKSSNQKVQTVFSQFMNFNNINYIKNILESVLSDVGFTVNFDKLPEFITYTKQKDEKNICNYFVDNTKLIESCDETKPVPFDKLMKSMECKTCGFYENLHKVCSKYTVESGESIDYDDYDDFYTGCSVCGQSKYNHKICDSYSTTNYDSCDKCGRDLYSHREQAKKNGQKHCGNFVNNSKDNKKECENCIFSETEHFLNPMLFIMNRVAYDKFTDLTFSFQAKFISCSDLQKYFYSDMFYSVLKMNYSKDHPSFIMFQNAEIPIVSNVPIPPIHKVQISLV